MSNQQISKWDTVSYQGQRGEVIAVDSDPAAHVMIILASDPDRSLFVPRSSITLISKY